MDMTDAALVAQARAGDREAFGRLVDRHRPMLMRLVLRMLNNPFEAEDLAQEACLHALLELRSLREPARFGAWLAGIGLNLARMRLRRLRFRGLADEWEGGRLEDGFIPSNLPSPEAVYEARELDGLVLRAIAGLPAELQAAVRLHYFEGLSLAEIAALVGVPAGTIKARLHRARSRLRMSLAPARPSGSTKQIQEARMIEVIVQGVVVETAKMDDLLEASGSEAAPAGIINPLQVPVPPEQLLHRVVLLKERDGQRVLPIWIGPWEGDMIALALAEQSAPRPMPYELMMRLMEAGQMSLERATVSQLTGDVFYSTLELRGSGQAHAIDARPSDAIALALRAKAPLFVDESVLKNSGVDMADAPGGADWQTLNGHDVLERWKQARLPSQKK
jgi:RNA polymerase sigma factor (sigma-70 family)